MSPPPSDPGALNTTQALLGLGSLGLILLFGGWGILSYAQAPLDVPYRSDDVYTNECGACHLDYTPGLAPQATWNKILAGLEDHFGEDATVDEATLTHLHTYLAAEALRPGKPTEISKMLRNLPADPPLRITEFPAFVDAHAQVAEQLEMSTFPEGFLSPCKDCHRDADLGYFDKQDLHPGYGPSIWGGDKPPR